MNPLTLQATTPAWKEAADSSKAERIPWEDYLGGKTLRGFAGDCAKEGIRVESCLFEVRFMVERKLGMMPKDMARKAKIGVSAGYSEYRRSLKKVETMEEKIEEIPNTPEGFETETVSWKDLGTGNRDSKTYLTVDFDQWYDVVITEAKLKRDSVYKDKKGNPKLKVCITFAEVNGEKVPGLKWETGSWTVIKELKKAIEEEVLSTTLFTMKKKKEDNKTIYLFERKRALTPSPPSSSDSVGAML